MLQNCEPYGKLKEGGGPRVIKHIHTHNSECASEVGGGHCGRKKNMRSAY